MKKIIFNILNYIISNVSKLQNSELKLKILNWRKKLEFSNLYGCKEEIFLRFCFFIFRGPNFLFLSFSLINCFMHPIKCFIHSINFSKFLFYPWLELGGIGFFGNWKIRSRKGFLKANGKWQFHFKKDISKARKCEGFSKNCFFLFRKRLFRNVFLHFEKGFPKVL